MFELPKRAFRRTIALLQTRQGAAVVWVSAATACRKNKTYEHWNPVWRLIKYQGTAWWLASHAVPMQWSYWNEGGSLCWSECSLTHYPMGRFRSVTDGGSKRHVAKWPSSWFRKSINLSSGWWWSWYPLGVSPPKKLVPLLSRHTIYTPESQYDSGILRLHTGLLFSWGKLWSGRSLSLINWAWLYSN